MPMTLSGNGTITGLVAGGLPDGTIVGSDLASGATTSNLGYTPVNKAGDSMSGGLTLRGDGINSLIEPHGGQLIRSGLFNNVNSGASGYSQSWVEYQLAPNVYKTCFSVYFGPGPANSRSYWYWTRNTGQSTWMDFMKFEMWEGNWNWGQQVGWKEYYITASSNSWAVTLGDNISIANFGSSLNMNVKVNGTSNVIIGGGNTAAANSIRYQVYSSTQIFSHNMNLVHSATNPFV